jgi:hypothetical protein
MKLKKDGLSLTIFIMDIGEYKAKYLKVKSYIRERT